VFHFQAGANLNVNTKKGNDSTQFKFNQEDRFWNFFKQLWHIDFPLLKLGIRIDTVLSNPVVPKI